MSNNKSEIKSEAWKKQFEYGFHLRMYLNHANIVNHESRFLANVIVWAWLYPHLINPQVQPPVTKATT